MQRVISSQSETIIELQAKLVDSVKNTGTPELVDTIKYFSYKSKWTDVSGSIDISKGTVGLKIQNRESLKVVETVSYKRFLGFLWKTNKIKDKQVDIVSENPNTKIVNCEYISIKQ